MRTYIAPCWCRHHRPLCAVSPLQCRLCRLPTSHTPPSSSPLTSFLHVCRGTVSLVTIPRYPLPPLTFRLLSPSKTRHLQWWTRCWRRCYRLNSCLCRPYNLPSPCHPQCHPPPPYLIPHPSPYMRAPPRFRALLPARCDARGFQGGCAPPHRSAQTGPPLESPALRRCSSITGTSTRYTFTVAGCLRSHRLVWMVQVSTRFSSGCSCSTNQPGNGPVRPTYL